MSSADTTVWDFDHDIDPPGHVDTAGQIHPSDVIMGALKGIHAGIDHLANSEKIKQAKRDRLAASVSNYSYGQTGKYASGSNLVLDLGAPALGTWWQIRRVVIGAPTITSSRTGTAYLYISGNPPADAGISNVADFYSALPSFKTYGTHQQVATGTEHVWVVIVGGTNAALYSAEIKVEAFDESMYAAAALAE